MDGKHIVWDPDTIQEVDPKTISSTYMLEFYDVFSSLIAGVEQRLKTKQGLPQPMIDAFLRFASRFGAVSGDNMLDGRADLETWLREASVAYQTLQEFEWNSRNGPYCKNKEMRWPFWLPQAVSLQDLQIVLIANGLKECLLIEAWLALQSRRAFIRCERCEKWIDYVHAGGKAAQVYCSENCRANAYYKRKRRAKELSAKGKTAGSIAKELGSTTETVRGWLKK